MVALRAKAGVSQEKIANLIDVLQQTYYGIETGKKNMSWTTYVALIFFFNKTNAIRQMIKDLKTYPTDWIEKFNEVR